MNIKDIKLVVWDLDETFWDGTISEGEIKPINENITLLKNLTDAGVVNSICSKNDFDVAKNKLIEMGIWEYFVFPSISWESKGFRVKQTIEAMKLRAPNVLFIDDNVQNLEEAKNFCEGIMTLLPSEIPSLCKMANDADKKDVGHKRLAQYKLLESKTEAQSSFSSNEEFLFSCNIRVNIDYNCEKEIDRIHDLVMRSNQLNYTKNRQSKEELEALIKSNDVKSGFVSASDNFGEYGIIGFFAIRDNKLIHYTFSCRTLGMKIEQFVYFEIGCPMLDVVGEVVTELNDNERPAWINQENIEAKNTGKASANGKILLKGPCDMLQIFAFIQENASISTEFTYTNDDGVSIEGHNHTSQIVTALYASEERKQEILSDVDFFDKDMLSTSITSEKYDFVVLSMLTDGNLGIYRKKGSTEEIALCEGYYDLTDEKNRQAYKEKSIFTSSITFTDENLETFAKKYEFVKKSPEKTVSNLDKIRNYLDSETTLVLLLPPEKEFKKKCLESYVGRHLDHIEMNKQISSWAADKKNVILIPLTKYIKSNADYRDTITHFDKRVYYELAYDLVNVFNKDDEQIIKVKGKSALLKANILRVFRKIKRILFRK